MSCGATRGIDFEIQVLFKASMSANTAGPNAVAAQGQQPVQDESPFRKVFGIIQVSESSVVDFRV